MDTDTQTRTIFRRDIHLGTAFKRNILTHEEPYQISAKKPIQLYWHYGKMSSVSSVLRERRLRLADHAWCSKEEVDSEAFL